MQKFLLGVVFLFNVASPLWAQTVEETELQAAYQAVMETQLIAVNAEKEYQEAIFLFNRELDKADPALVPDPILGLTAQNIVNARLIFSTAYATHEIALERFKKIKKNYESELATNE